jgi:hypothetical protein
MLTKEGKRVAKHVRIDRPTQASEVTPDTPLEKLNLNWHEKDLPERERTKHVHRLHPYLGKFIPQLVEIFLRKYLLPGQTVIDPFCGSGTTLIQANELGINAIGYDVSAFNVLLCRVKTAKYNLAETRKEVLDILKKVRLITHENNHQLDLWTFESNGFVVPQSDNQYLQRWFAPQALHELLAYRLLIDTEGYQYQDLLKIILSRSARSARLTTHFDLDFPRHPQTVPYWCYKHARECYPNTEALKFLERYSFDTLRRLEEFSTLRTNTFVDVHHANSLNAVFPPAHCVITSPPYVGLIDYHEQHAYAYHLLGLDDKRNEEIGPAANGSSEKAREKYQKDIAEVFRRLVNTMPQGGHLIVVAADRANLYSEMPNIIGVDVEGVVQRHVNRRTGRRSSEFYESVFVWRKF